MSTHASRYAAYGLCMRSEVALPFRAGSPNGEPDVTIRFGPTPETLGASGERYGLWQSMPGAYLLDVDGVARYLVTGGREIVVEPTGDGDAAVSVFLLGSVLAACLQQRGIVTLHASAIETGGGAVLFAGVSGSGKSTLLAALVDRGYAMLADDVTGVVLGTGGRPVALSAFPCVRLWADAVDGLAWRGRTRGRVRDELEKYLAPVERFRTEPLAVGAVFTLASHNRDEFEIDPASRPVAFEQLLRHTYRMRALRGLGRQRDHFRAVGALARQAPLTCVKRPAHPFRLEALADEIERRLPVGRTEDADHPPAPAVGSAAPAGDTGVVD
jgi:hypothetical protein